MDSNSANITSLSQNLLIPKNIKGNYLFNDIVSVSGDTNIQVQSDSKDFNSIFDNLLPEEKNVNNELKSEVKAVENIIKLLDSKENIDLSGVNIFVVPQAYLDGIIDAEPLTSDETLSNDSNTKNTDLIEKGIKKLYFEEVPDNLSASHADIPADNSKKKLTNGNGSYNISINGKELTVEFVDAEEAKKILAKISPKDNISSLVNVNYSYQEADVEEINKYERQNIDININEEEKSVWTESISGKFDKTLNEKTPTLNSNNPVVVDAKSETSFSLTENSVKNGIEVKKNMQTIVSSINDDKANSLSNEQKITGETLTALKKNVNIKSSLKTDVHGNIEQPQSRVMSVDVEKTSKEKIWNVKVNSNDKTGYSMTNGDLNRAENIKEAKDIDKAFENASTGIEKKVNENIKPIKFTEKYVGDIQTNEIKRNGNFEHAVKKTEIQVNSHDRINVVAETTQKENQKSIEKNVEEIKRVYKITFNNNPAADKVVDERVLEQKIVLIKVKGYDKTFDKKTESVVINPSRKELSLEDLNSFSNRITRSFGLPSQLETKRIDGKAERKTKVNIFRLNETDNESKSDAASPKADNRINAVTETKDNNIYAHKTKDSSLAAQHNKQTEFVSENSPHVKSAVESSKDIDKTNINIKQNFSENIFLNEVAKPVSKTEFNGFGSSSFSKEMNVKTLQYKEINTEIMKLINRGESHSVELKLNPKELGSVKILIDVTNNVVNARVDVESDQIKQLLANNVNHLKETMQQQGLILNQFNINYHSNNNRSKAKNGRNIVSDKMEKIDEFQDENLNNRSIGKKMGYNSFDYIA